VKSGVCGNDDYDDDGGVIQWHWFHLWHCVWHYVSFHDVPSCGCGYGSYCV